MKSASTSSSSPSDESSNARLFLLVEWLDDGLEYPREDVEGMWCRLMPQNVAVASG